MLRPFAQMADDFVVTSEGAGLMPGGLTLPDSEFAAWRRNPLHSMRDRDRNLAARRVDLTLPAGELSARALQDALAMLTPRIGGAFRAVRPEDGWHVAHAAFTADEQTLSGVVRGFVGSGGAARPAGDDLIVGVCAGLQRAGRRAAARRVARAAVGEAHRTTRSARLFVGAAAEGRFSERVHRFVDGLRSTSGVAPAMRALDRWGATSGVDLAVGLLGAAARVHAARSAEFRWSAA